MTFCSPLRFTNAVLPGVLSWLLPPIVSGWPDCATNRPLTCHPPMILPARLSLIHRLLGPNGSS